MLNIPNNLPGAVALPADAGVSYTSGMPEVSQEAAYDLAAASSLVDTLSPAPSLEMDPWNKAQEAKKTADIESPGLSSAYTPTFG